MNIIPCGHRVVVEILDLTEIDEVYKSAKALGIDLSASQDIQREQQSVDKGVIRAIGQTAFRDFGGDAWCKVGDTVAFAKYSGKTVKDLVTGKSYLVLNDEDCICILTQGENNE